MTTPFDGWVDTVGWALVHFVWQGAAIALATAALLAASRKRSSEVRYGVACCGLVAMLAAPAVTAAVLRSPVPPHGLETVTRAAFGPDAPSPLGFRAGEPQSPGATPARTSAAIERFLPALVSAWLCGVVLLLARFAGASWRVRRLRLSSIDAPPSRWQPAGERLAARLGLRQAFRIVDSELVDVPSVIGVVRPIVLLPLAALTSLSPDQIEALVVHELAHIRRRDYFVNIVQTMVETLLFFHPAVWWLSGRIRQEREHCCDDIAVQACGEPVVYASALAELASSRTRELALSLGAADGALLARVRRILDVAEPSAPRAVGGSIALAIALIATAGLAAQATAPRMPPTQGASTGERIVTVTTKNLTEEFRLRTTDHFQLFYQRELDLHADRVAREAEAAYARVSDDLRHNLAKRIPLFVVRSAAEIERLGATLDASASGVLDWPAGDHILLAVDQPADQWLGIITHEIAHVFGFDILPSKSIAPWIREGLAEYERGSWDPNDLALLREAVRSNAVPAMSTLQGDGGRPMRLVSALGHAAFDFIESRAGKAGVRQFLFALRKTADTGADPFQAVLPAGRDAFDREFEAYLRSRFTTAANQTPRARADIAVSLRVEGEVTAIHKAAAAGLACIELWVAVGDGIRRQRWAVECPASAGDDALDALKPGDRVVVTGPLAHGITYQRVTLESLTRPADGFTWPARRPRPTPAASPRP